jgi:hypothetical protein
MITIALGSSLFADDRPAKEQIREYITQAAAMQRADFNAIARATGTPKVEDYSDKSLTLVLLCNKGIREEGKFDQFQFQTDRTPRPNELVGEVNRGLGGYPLFLPTAPVSMIHQDRITDITCEVKGNKATGVVSYQVPGMYFGKVKYIAEKTPTHWYITELIVSDYDIHLIRGERGLWKEKE